MMSIPLRVLILEDRPADAELMIHELERAGFKPAWQRVETEADYLAQLRTLPDIILADHTLPQFGAPEAIEMLKSQALDIPLIIVTGSISEEVAVKRIKEGAADYILKDRMVRLGPAVQHALDEKKLRDEKRRAQEEIKRNLERIGALHEIDMAITSALDLRTVLDLLLEKTDLFIPYATATTVRLFNEESRLLEPIACRNLNEAVWKAEEWRAGHGLPNVVFETNAPLMVKNVQTDPRTRDPEFFRTYGLISYLGVPLTAKRDVLGVLGLYTKKEHEFTKEEVEFFSTLAGQAAIAINNSQLYEESKRQAAELERTNQDLKRREETQRLLKELSQDITTLDIDSLLKKLTEKVREVFKVDVCDVRITKKRVWELGAISGVEPGLLRSGSREPHRGRLRRIVENRRPLVIPDLNQSAQPTTSESVRRLGIRGYLGVPLFSRGGQALGVLRGLTYQPREFTQEEVDLLQQLAIGAAIAIENTGLYEDIKRQAVELERSNRVKDEFLSVMSHELRTPLTVATGYIGMMQEGILGELSPQQVDALQKITRRNQDLLEIINSILSVTKIQARATPLEREEVHLKDLLDDLRSCYELPMEKELCLQWDYPPELPVINTDSSKLKQVLQNLVNNAIKFTDQGSVTVSAKIREETTGNRQKFVEFQVTDTGIGIPTGQQSFIFDKFYQVDSSETRHYGGVGLGLYIARTFTDMLGGKVEVESEPGKGSTFTVTIPYETQ